MNTLRLIEHAFELRLIFTLLLLIVSFITLRIIAVVDARLDQRRANKSQPLSADAYATQESVLAAL